MFRYRKSIEVDPFIQYFRIKIKQGEYCNLSEMKDKLRQFFYWGDDWPFRSYIISNYKDVPIELIEPMRRSLWDEMFPNSLQCQKKAPVEDPFIQYLKIKVAEGKSCNIFLMKENLRAWVWESSTFKENCINQYPDVPIALIESMQRSLWNEMYPKEWFLCRKNIPAEKNEKNTEEDISKDHFNQPRKLGLFYRGHKVKYFNSKPCDISCDNLAKKKLLDEETINKYGI